MNEEIMRQMGFGKHVERVKAGKCGLCGKKINLKDFRDELSLKEYSISGLCQACQDTVWPEEEEFVGEDVSDGAYGV